MQPESIQVEAKIFQRMLFINNALEKGWSVKKTNDTYIFSKKHENKKEVFQSDYLERFIESNCDISILLESAS
jgi:hypothetical protein